MIIQKLYNNNIDKVQRVQSKLNYSFTNVYLLTEALCHPSLKQEYQNFFKDYERLEFLGDSVLNLIITDVLFDKFINYREGDLAKIRAFLVRKESLYFVAQKIDLALSIIMANSEEDSGGRSNINNLENAMEAVIGAIYKDSHFANTVQVVLPLWQDLIVNYQDYLYTDPKSLLQEWSQSHNLGIPKYQTIQTDGPAHQPKFVVSVTVESIKPQYGAGPNIKSAQKQAATKMLEIALKLK